MTWKSYGKDKMQILLFQAFCAIFSFLYFYAAGVELAVLLLFYIAWAVVLAIYFLRDYRARKNYLDKIAATLEGLDKPYLMAQLMPDSWRLEDGLYREILRVSNKSAVDEVHHLEREQKEYREFMENWIHEVKLPITAIQLICHNHKTPETRRIQEETEILYQDVERALFYARSDQVYQDYMIRPINLRETVYQAIDRNRVCLQRNQMELQIEIPDRMQVYCDDKWLIFLLGQVFFNAVKYKKEEYGPGKIQIHAQRMGTQTCLKIRDKGMGIPDQEIDRIFEKGFTGSNGRRRQYSTGMGLYLCKKLCRKLGISIEAESREGEYTEILLYFPDDSSFFARKN